MKRKKIISILTCTLLGLLMGGCTSCKNQGTIDPADLATSNNVVSLKSTYISENSIILGTGETHQLSLGNTTAKSWDTSDATIVTVNNGLITAENEGIAFITAVSEQDEKFICIVNVTNESSFIKIDLSSYYKTIGINDILTISATPMEAESLLNRTVEWIVVDDSIAEISKHGNLLTIKGLKAGKTSVMATLDDSIAVFDLTVRAEANTLGTFDGPDEMENAPITKMAFNDALQIESVVKGDNTIIYPTTHYSENAMVLYGTLTSGNRAFEWKKTGHFAYGFMVEPIVVYDSNYISAQEKYYAYYALEGTDTNGNYGVIVEDLPEGYYEIRAFVEYESAGEIIREVSKERSVAGEFDVDFISSNQEFRATKLNVRWNYNGTMGFEETVETSSEMYTDKNNVTNTSKYVIEAELIEGTDGNNVIPGFMFRLKPTTTKRMLQEYLEDGLSVLKFSICYKSVGDYKGSLRVLNVSGLDEDAKATAAHFDSTIAWSFAYSNQQLGAFNKKIQEAILSTDGYTNTWYEFKIDVSKLVEYYDVLFHEHSGYPLCVFQFNSTAVDNEARTGKLLITDFEFETVTLDNLAPSSEYLNFYRTVNKTNNWGMPNYGSVKVEGVAVTDENSTYTDAKGATKEIAYKFEIPVKTEQSGGGNWMLMGFDMSYLTKDYLLKLQTDGYTKLEFSFVCHSTYNYGVDVATINFDYLRANTDKNCGTMSKLNKDAYTTTTISGAASCWTKVEYSLEDLIACYDQLSVGKYWVLGAACSNYTNNEVAYFYLTKVQIVKPDVVNIDLDNIAPTSEYFNFHRTTQSGTGWYLNTTNVNRVAVEAISGNGETYTDHNETTKTIAQKFEWDKRTAQTSGGGYMLMAVKMSHLTKEVLTELQASGKEKLTFSFVYHTTYEWALDVYTINFEWLKDNPTMSCYYPDNTSPLGVRKAAYTKTTYSGQYQPCNWQTIEYSLSDLITYYDQIFVGEYLVLGTAITNYMNSDATATDYFYMSNIVIS